jgi:hypothetical protein
MNRLDALERQPGADDGQVREPIQELRQQINAHIGDESSWQPFRLYVNQTQLHARDSAFGGEIRATGASPADKDERPTGFAERFLGGGRVTLGGKVNVAHGGRDLIILDVTPPQA